MGIFRNWPYTNFHDLNLDRILDRTKEAEEAAQQAANDAATSAAGIAAANSKSTEALSKANAAVNTANGAAADAEQALTYSRAKAQHCFEIIIDDQNSAITITDCATGEVIASEDDLKSVMYVCNKFFGTDWTIAGAIDLTPADYEYPNMSEVPMIKIVNTYQPIYAGYATLSFNARGNLSLSWLKPGNTPAVKTLTIGANANFIYANCTIA